MLDLGIQNGKGNSHTDDYDSFYLSQLDVGNEITGEIYIGELKAKEIKSKEVQEFYVILTDHENKQKWICGLITSAYFDDDIAKIYGEKGGRIYELIDTLNHATNNTTLNERESYSAVFETFRESINNKIENVTVKAVQASNPNARTPNLHVIKATVKEGIEDETETKGSTIRGVDEPEVRNHLNYIRTQMKSKGLNPNDKREVKDYLYEHQEDEGLSNTDIGKLLDCLAEEEREGK